VLEANRSAIAHRIRSVHWVDPTTKEFLTLLVERVRGMLAVVVLTFRPEMSAQAWADRPH
jgi:predicted ATPase